MSLETLDAVSSITLHVPEIGDADKIELVAWHVREGDAVRPDQELCELVTDKAAFPLESPQAGRIKNMRRRAGDVVKVGEVLADLEID